MRVFTLINGNGDGYGNGNGIVGKWVVDPFVTAMTTARMKFSLDSTQILSFHCCCRPLRMNSCNDAVAVAVTQCERAFRERYI